MHISVRVVIFHHTSVLSEVERESSQHKAVVTKSTHEYWQLVQSCMQTRIRHIPGTKIAQLCFDLSGPRREDQVRLGAQLS